MKTYKASTGCWLINSGNILYRELSTPDNFSVANLKEITIVNGTALLKANQTFDEAEMNKSMNNPDYKTQVFDSVQWLEDKKIPLIDLHLEETGSIN